MPGHPEAPRAPPPPAIHGARTDAPLGPAPGGPPVGAYDSSRHRLVFPNDSILQFGHCNTDADFTSYLSTEWGIIGVDEASQFTPYQLAMLPSRLRTTIAGFQTQYVLASNPGGPGHQWLKARFLDKQPDPEETPDCDPSEWVYIPSRLADNPTLGPRTAVGSSSSRKRSVGPT